MLGVLRQRNFFLLWLGGLISPMGDWILNIGLPIYVFLLTHSVLATSGAILAGASPAIAVGPVAGIFVDRWDRKRTLVVANLLLALALLPLLLARTPDRVWIVYCVIFVEGCLEQFVSPATNALLPALIGEDRLVSANALSSLSSNLARLLGPALGGVIAGVFALNGIVLADAVSFLLAALLIAGISNSARVSTSSTSSAQSLAIEVATTDEALASSGGIVARIWRDWLEGLRVIRTDRTLTILFGMFSISMLGEGVFATLYPIFVYQALHGGALQIGELMSAQAVGGLLGGLVVGWAGKRVMSRWVIGFGQIGFGLIDLAIFNSPTFFPLYALSVALFVVVGAIGIAPLTGAQSLLQARSPDAYRGRVFGALGAVTGLCLLVGALLAGAITPRLGVVTVLNIQGVGYVLAGLVAMLLLGGAKNIIATPTLEQAAQQMEQEYMPSCH